MAQISKVIYFLYGELVVNEILFGGINLWVSILAASMKYYNQKPRTELSELLLLLAPRLLPKSLPPPQNLCMALKTFACVSLRYRKHCGVGVGGGDGGNSGSEFVVK